ncbi:type VI secretion protein [Erwinia sp. OLTSP20]|uniref:type VI secretion system baseplate subunit TssG n=1 Tax=unclassified Erwinia TaxID=2622719 RepID=UPI000C1764AE|nr:MULTISPECIES: type VI secretion system baseplate subunit TssG [unclassified Erwinia]PIJ49606.1 type VI secretion protein [Erwinia sp. OAMSP11]PIJ71602.1 type VI secretion protein [Erwinia sp. OLSSP12]PIJ82672.1 type VI secretion protein [Erwinia sp. OLCASP19]PIJ83139.1 type VI secretion protein [Erwinia sp. OLMTSP26]PIJ85305.1 type VI secretion protein [Erwinia sp. OLMDSP33]
MSQTTRSLPTVPPQLTSWYQQDKPWQSGFISIMRTLAAQTPEWPAPGTALLPSQECFRLRQLAHMVFAPREIARIEKEADKLHLYLFGLGVWGPQGAMPLHLSEVAYTRSENHDNTLNEFVDIFHHRALSHFYRAWFLSQDTASLDRQHEDKFSFYVGSLAGLEPQELAGSELPLHPRLASVSHLIREARNPEGLVGALHYYFEVPVQIREFAVQWIFLQAEDQSQLGNNLSCLKLGDGAILGDTVQDRQHKFQLLFGPLSLKQYLHFSPWGKDLPVLREWVRNFVGFEYAWEVILVLSADEVPCATLGEQHQLGYTGWLERADCSSPLAGMSFDPEMYCQPST